MTRSTNHILMMYGDPDYLSGKSADDLFDSSHSDYEHPGAVKLRNEISMIKHFTKDKETNIYWAFCDLDSDAVHESGLCFFTAGMVARGIELSIEMEEKLKPAIIKSEALYGINQKLSYVTNKGAKHTFPLNIHVMYDELELCHFGPDETKHINIFITLEYVIKTLINEPGYFIEKENDSFVLKRLESVSYGDSYLTESQPWGWAGQKLLTRKIDEQLIKDGEKFPIVLPHVSEKGYCRF